MLMGKNKAKGMAKAALIATVLLVLLAVRSPSAQTSSFCQDVIPQAGATFLSQTGSINTMLGISIVIMLTMAALSGMLYMIGYSFRINNLVRVSKQEFGEIAVTALIVLVFVGTFTLLSNASISPKLFSNTGAYSQGIFADDCNVLSGYALVMFEYSFDLGIVQDFTLFASTIKVSYMPEGYGISFSPLSGYATSFKVIALLFLFAGGMSGLLLGIGVVLGIFYAIMPLFLFAGIILRTLPWTRAAGGAFLGIFLGFFIVFPVLLHFLLYNTPPSINLIGGSPSEYNQITIPSFSDIFNMLNPGATFTIRASLNSIIDPSYATDVILSVLIPGMYGVFSFAFAFIISFDFAETAGDFLGSPSLSTSRSLNKLL